MKIQLRIRNVEYKCRYYLSFIKKIYIYINLNLKNNWSREKSRGSKKRSFLLIYLVKNFAYYFFKSSTTTTSSERRKIERQIGLSKNERATRWKKRKKKKNVVVGNVTRNTKVWTSSIGDAYGNIVGAEARVKSRGNRSLWRGRRRVATDVDGPKSTRVATRLSFFADRSIRKKVHASKIPLTNLSRMRAYFATILHGNDIFRVGPFFSLNLMYYYVRLHRRCFEYFFSLFL